MDDHILEWHLTLPLSVIEKKINNPTCDAVNDVNEDFSLKYSNNKMGLTSCQLITHVLIYCIKN